jgi:hypothetical protein
MLITATVTNIMIIFTLLIFSSALFENAFTILYATSSATSNPFIQIFVPLTLNKIQYLPNQIMFHLDNQTSGAIETISNETGKNITKYFKYNPYQNTVAISNSTIYTHYELQVPFLGNSNTYQIQKINRAFDVKYIANPDPRISVPSITYLGEINSKFLSINGISYDKLNVQVIVPYDYNKYQSIMILYPSINKNN